MSDIIQKGPTKRLIHLDILRLLAIYLVVFNHTGEQGYMLFAGEIGSLMYFPHMFFSVFCKIAVPVFFMISGALLLPREETLGKLFSKRVLRMVIILLIISIPYYYWLNRSHGISPANFLTYIYGNSASTSLWYLYSYIGLLLLLPFLRSMVKGLNQKHYVYLFIGHVILVGIIPCLEYCLWRGDITLNPSFSAVLFVTQNVFFALMGYFLERVLEEKHYNKKTLIIGVVLSIIAICSTCFMTYYQATNLGVCTNNQQEAFFNTFICIPAVTVYFAVKMLASKIRSERAGKILSVFGAAVFGIYLIEKVIRAFTGGVHNLLSPIIGSFAASLIWSLAVCIVGFAVIIPLKNIPGLKKIVNKFI